jgi:microsomal epoxide hydrolase
MTRRDALRLLSAVLTLPRFQQAATTGVRPFKVDIPPAVINRILARVKSTRLPDPLESTDWRYGANWNYMKSLVDYWTTEFDWKKAQANLNRYTQFKAKVEDYDIHFYHVKGRGSKPMPLILTHGWPGSVFEFIEAIGPLTESGEDSFDVVVPSIPGFGFSSKPKQPIGPPTTARLWHKLMTDVLGYSKFGAQGGDWGNAITLALARAYPQSLVGIHLNAAGAGGPQDNQTDEEKTWERAVLAARAQELDYFNEQQHKPGTVAFALYDNPVGTAAWIAEKFKVWTDTMPSMDQVLTNIMIYLVTDTPATAVWFYRGAADDPATPARGKLEVPMGFLSSPKEIAPLNPPRSVLERYFNLVHYTKMEHGGHFACLEQPKPFVDDVRAFFRKVR